MVRQRRQRAAAHLVGMHRTTCQLKISAPSTDLHLSLHKKYGHCLPRRSFMRCTRHSNSVRNATTRLIGAGLNKGWPLVPRQQRKLLLLMLEPLRRHLPPPSLAASPLLYVCCTTGDDAEGDGSITSPLLTAHEALRRLRNLDAEGHERKTIVLKAGIHYFNDTLVLTEADSHTTIRGEPGAWISGGV